jgi:hypothetical protein
MRYVDSHGGARVVLSHRAPDRHRVRARATSIPETPLDQAIIVTGEETHELTLDLR